MMMVKIGALQVDLDQRQVHKQGFSVQIGARAFDILSVLYRANGAVLSKDEIMDAVWPGRVVEENNLQVHVAALRRLLGADRDLIKTVAGRGYMLVRKNAQENVWQHAEAFVEKSVRQPPRIAHSIGREAEIAWILEQLGAVPVITIVGAGGIGKTCLALHAASEMPSRSGRAVRFVELNKASSRETALSTIADALDLQIAHHGANEDVLATAVAASNCLLVLDNAEHVIDVIAGFVDKLVSRDHQARVLLTSREPLNIRSELVLRLEPLAVPAIGLSTEIILQHAAVILFVCRARALAPECARDAASIALVAEICRRLEGLPLAIELAAARVAALGVAGVASRLDDRLNLLTGGLRSTLPRHQTLRETFEWSYQLLDAASRTLFRRLGCFVGTFTFDAVCAVVSEPGVSIGVIVWSLGELATKSLLNVELRGAIAVYRLTESTRAYALEKLRDEGETQVFGGRYSRYMRKRIEEGALSTAGPKEQGGGDENGRFSLDDARSAYEWAFSAEGDPVLGVALAGVLVGALLCESRVQECCERARRALSVLDSLPRGSVDAICEMKLCAAYASSLLHGSDTVGTAVSMWERVLRLARSAHDDEAVADSLWGLWNTMIAIGNIHASIRYATRFQQFASTTGSSVQHWLAEQMLAISLHCFGEHEQARERLERTVDAFASQGEHSCARGGLNVSPLIYASGTLARIAMFQGRPERAMQLVESVLGLISGDMPEPSLSHVLAAVAIPIAMDCGEQEAASRYLALLRSQAAIHRLDSWLDFAECLAAKDDMRVGRFEAALERLEPALRRLSSRGFRRVVTPFVVLHAQALTAVNRLDEARARLEGAMAHARENGEEYFAPELLRARGGVELQHAALRGAPAEESRLKENDGRRMLIAAMEQASGHGASLFELRAALDLAEHWLDKGEVANATALIEGRADRIDTTSKALDFQRFVKVADRVKRAAAAAQDTSSREPAQGGSTSCEVAGHPAGAAGFHVF
ncbi:MAG TPA: winged helix-turn-helix domain-containing protein [Paraburkholderia sp.]|nr:winged helix-turn-helix domain-containing protein [Paraburkholderia sp.]